jgi:hypothetical protein
MSEMRGVGDRLCSGSSPRCTAGEGLPTGCTGLSPFVSIFSTSPTTSIPSTTRPKTTCLPSRCSAFRNVMKN